MPTNRAASPQRRPRTAAANNPPTIALHVAQIADVVTYAASVTQCCDALSPALSVPVVVQALQSSSIATLREDIVTSVHAMLTGHGCKRPAAAVVNSTLHGLQTTWDAATGENLEEAIATAVSRGVDGELVCWHVISLESERHVGLIRKEASKIVKKLPHTPPDDLLGYGWSGLRAALRAYDPSLGFAFSTYACPRINGAIRDGVRGENPLPKRLTTLARSVSTAEEVLTHRLSRIPTYQEITDYLDAGTQAALLSRLGPTASLDELTDPWRETSREPACLVDESDVAEEAWRLMRVDAVRGALEKLPADEADLIRLVYLEDRSLAETARVLGKDIRDLRKIKRHAMAALATSLEDWQAVPA